MLPPDVLGWCAAALMVATFACRDARRMRPLAVATNLAFIGYGVAAALAPVLALHALLLPINLWRWAEARGAGVPTLSTTTTPVPWRTAAMVLVFMLLAACSGGGEPEPAPPEFVQVGRVVEISAIQADGRHIEAETNHLVGPERCGEPGEDRASVEMGGLPFILPGHDAMADGATLQRVIDEGLVELLGQNPQPPSSVTARGSTRPSATTAAA